MKGIKYDDTKPRYELLPPKPIEDIVKVLTVGARKYSDENWRYVDPLYDRYYAAALRHIQAWRMGEVNDPETGLPHLAHAGCCLIFLMEGPAKKVDGA